MGLCCGLSAIRFAFTDRWELVIAFIMAATVIDGLDGRIARMLNATSTFGAELDSLADFLSFGVAPVLALYLWTLHDYPRIGWAVVMLYAVCCALRLARFNTMQLSGAPKQPWQNMFFTGAPAPSGANLCMVPMAAWLEFGDGIANDPHIVAAYIAGVALFMVSRVPTYSVKHIKILHGNVLPVLVACGGIITFFVIDVWKAYWVFGIVYLALVPVTVIHYLSLKKRSR